MDLGNVLNTLTNSAADVATLVRGGTPTRPAQPAQPAAIGGGLPKWLLPAGIGLAAVLLVGMVLSRR